MDQATVSLVDSLRSPESGSRLTKHWNGPKQILARFGSQFRPRLGLRPGHGPGAALAPAWLGGLVVAACDTHKNPKGWLKDPREKERIVGERVVKCGSSVLLDTGLRKQLCAVIISKIISLLHAYKEMTRNDEVITTRYI
ncbi:hypothetical protein R6Q59_001577 [Mikania micrantha]